jgi:hypothetical protein
MFALWHFSNPEFHEIFSLIRNFHLPLRLSQLWILPFHTSPLELLANLLWWRWLFRLLDWLSCLLRLLRGWWLFFVFFSFVFQLYSHFFLLSLNWLRDFHFLFPLFDLLDQLILGLLELPQKWIALWSWKSIPSRNLLFHVLLRLDLLMSHLLLAECFLLH